MWCSVNALRHSKHGMQWHLWEFKRKGKRKPQGYKPLSHIDFSSSKWVPRAGLWVFCIPMAWDCPSSNGPPGNICWMNKKNQLPVTKYVFSFHKRRLLCIYVCMYMHMYVCMYFHKKVNWEFLIFFSIPASEQPAHSRYSVDIGWMATWHVKNTLKWWTNRTSVVTWHQRCTFVAIMTVCCWMWDTPLMGAQEARYFASFELYTQWLWGPGPGGTSWVFLNPHRQEGEFFGSVRDELFYFTFPDHHSCVYSCFWVPELLWLPCQSGPSHLTMMTISKACV